MKLFLQIAGLLLAAWACQTVPDPAEKSYNISASDDETASRREACSFRYKIDNSFNRLNNQLQQAAIRAAFDLWQNANPNILFLQKQDGLVSEINIRFELLTKDTAENKKAAIGLIRGNLESLSKTVRSNDNTTIILDSAYDWDMQSITRVLAFQIGAFLGMKKSEDVASLLYPIYMNQEARMSATDSLAVNGMYNEPCAGECRDFLPARLPLHGMATRTLRIDQPGKITITSTGSMIVGVVLGWSTPDGLSKGLFNFPIGDFSLERAYNHATVVYKLGSEQRWRACNSKCEFETDGVSQCLDITLAVNDNDTLDNIGNYDVVVDYKR